MHLQLVEINKSQNQAEQNQPDIQEMDLQELLYLMALFTLKMKMNGLFQVLAIIASIMSKSSQLCLEVMLFPLEKMYLEVKIV